MNLLQKFRETAWSVLPVMGLVLALGLLAVPAGAGGPWWLGRFLVGGALLVLGLTVFLLGVDLGIRPMGERCGAALTAKRSLALLLGAAFVVGLVVTAAEPDIQVFGDQVRGVFPAVRKGALTFSIAGGVGLFMALGMLRTTLGIPLKAVLAASYAALFLLAAFAPAPFVGVAFDSGGATTGPMTVPFILALGIGVAAVRARGDRDGGFGLTGVASVGPVAAVLVYSLLNTNVAAPHAEAAEVESHAEFAESLFSGGGSGEADPPPVETHAESAENAELFGGASSPSEPKPESVVCASGTSRAMPAKESEKSVRRKLRRTVVASVDWREADIDDVIHDLRDFSLAGDPDDPSGAGGVGFSVFLGDIEDRDHKDLFGPGTWCGRAKIPPFTMHATDIRLDALLDRIEKERGFAWRIEDGRVVLSRKVRPSGSWLSRLAGNWRDGFRRMFRRSGSAGSGDPFGSFPAESAAWEEPLRTLTADSFRRELAEGEPLEVRIGAGGVSAAIPASGERARRVLGAIAAADDVPPPSDLVENRATVFFTLRKEEPKAGLYDADDDSGPRVFSVFFDSGRSPSNADDLFFWENPDCETVVRVRGIAPLLDEAVAEARAEEKRIRETLGGIVLQAIDLRDASLRDVLAFFEASTKGRGGEDGAAIPFSFDEEAWRWSSPDDGPRLTIRSESAAFTNMLALVADMAGVHWRIVGGGVRCFPRVFEDGVSLVADPHPVPRPGAAAEPEPIQHSAFGIQHSSFFSSFAEAFPEALRESLSSIAPLFGLFLVFQFALLKMTLRQALRISIGFVWALIGLSVFLTGVNGGFMQAGRILGAALGGAAAAGGAGPWALLVGTGLAFGAVIVCAEPAVWVLSEQVEEASGGAIRRRTLLFFLSLGTALAIGLAMWRAVAGFPLWRLLLPGYALALLLLARTPQPFAGIAFDSGGVASGPLTSTFVLSFTLGAASAGGGGSDSFGVIALVAMMPLAAIQLMGILVERRKRRALRAPAAPAPTPGEETP